ncbi:hypothetical protein P1X14_02195 [Sphingomonas sp. AOB5]|uniref:DUF5681 domain-containing protein n=1 Tax=Sphingomonas sp. AOB5 TaxID=3034017 RepID=UPI0023F84FC7|nr:DUF5681 domain-containing protein [Sphingomonas sp. AOB5]MDF7774044.1 hypothetical protein [Sphingomonas sp. AOB5]
MTEPTQPEWMTNFVPTSTPARWVKGMPSPNPKGRPRGIIDKRSKVTQALMDEGLEIARVVTAAAKEGDLQACSIVLSRIAPALRPETYPVQFGFDASAPIARQIEQVLEAMSAGAVSPEVGKQIIDAIGTLSDARAVEELEARIMTLEAKQV